MKNVIRIVLVSIIAFSPPLIAQTNTFPSSGNVGIGTTSPDTKLEVNGLISGGFGAKTTSGSLDWNHISNSRSGSGYSLLRGNTTNAPGNTSNYFHPFNFEYSNKDGTGNVTQLAIPYGDDASINEGLYMRGRYSDNWTNWVKIISEDLNGRVGIGTISPDEKLTVAGSGKFKEVIVEENTGADFVFEEGYKLPDLSELEEFINANKHLPEIPTAEQMKEEGVKVGELQIKLLQKIEELTLYAIQENRSKSFLEDRIEAQQKTINMLVKQIEKLESKLGTP